MRVMRIRNNKKHFLEMKSNQKVQTIKWYPKQKIDGGFLGCVKCSTNGDLLGEHRIYVLTSGSGSGDIKYD
jgi:hypothetical protein